MACGGGIQERIKKVDIPIRANGKCPGEKHADRLQMRQCNTQDCVGDEICIAKMDLVIAFDSSGSMREKGFKIVQEFVGNLTGRYNSMYYGAEAMKVGILMFGNGQVAPDGTISDAEIVSPLTADIASLKPLVEATAHAKGITNMAQAFADAGKMLRQGGRKDAQSAVLVITDGKPSMKFVTGQQVDKLKEGNTHIYFAPIAEFPSKDFDILKEWASQPWETNYERIPGLDALANNFDMFGQRMIAKFCPNAFSPSQERTKSENAGYMLIREYGFPDEACGPYYNMGVYNTVDDCYIGVKEQGMMAFAYTHSGRMEGTCWAESFEVTQELWDTWSANATNPECPNGDWIFDPYSDSFAIDPASMADMMGGADE